jgi:CheY-like chemotaxis protein
MPGNYFYGTLINSFAMEPEKQNTPLNVMLADDDKDDRFFFEKALQDVSIPTLLITVKDGQELMDYLFKNSDHLPDVLFLDINMPRKKGSECLSEIKADPKLKALPVIIYSTSYQEDIAEEFYKTGAHYYMQKRDFPELAKAIHRALTMLAENPSQPARDKFVIPLIAAHA